MGKCAAATPHFRDALAATRPLASVPWLGDGDPTEWDEEATTATPILTAPLLEAETKKCSKKTVVEGAMFLQAAKYYFNQIAAQKRARLRVACDALAATRPLTSVPSLGEATPATSMEYPLRSTGPASSSVMSLAQCPPLSSSRYLVRSMICPRDFFWFVAVWRNTTCVACSACGLPVCEKFVVCV